MLIKYERFPIQFTYNSIKSIMYATTIATGSATQSRCSPPGNGPDNVLIYTHTAVQPHSNSGKIIWLMEITWAAAAKKAMYSHDWSLLRRQEKESLKLLCWMVFFSLSLSLHSLHPSLFVSGPRTQRSCLYIHNVGCTYNILIESTSHALDFFNVESFLFSLAFFSFFWWRKRRFTSNTSSRIEWRMGWPPTKQWNFHNFHLFYILFE
jgi:hypothetical protein